MAKAPAPRDRAADTAPEPGGDVKLALQEALGGRYWLERELGKGGMGIVYLAWDPALERQVALKILPPDAPAGRRTRFLGEARIAARLRHDHIVPIYAVGDAGPFVYYTMEYIRGYTLRDRIIAEGALAVADVTRILHDVARAVEYAHRQGVIHRDVKPSNILIEHEEDDAGPRAYVADFGLARALSDDLEGGAGQTFGTCHYASPEQAAGLRTDHRSDIYALGVVAYVMATGRTLFGGSDREVLEQHVATPAPALPVLGRHLDTTLSKAVARCLAKDPADRFQSAGDLARALSFAPELSDEPEPRLGEFVAVLRLQSRSAPTAVLLGLAGFGILQRLLGSDPWLLVGSTAGVVALILASPVVGVLPAARRLLGQGYVRDDIVRALNMDLDRQRRALAARWGGASETHDKGLRWILKGAGALFVLGMLAALSGLDLSTDLVLGSMVIGAFVAPVAGLALAWRERRRNELWGGRWLTFWASRLGAGTLRLAGLHLAPVRTDAALPPAPETAGALPDDLRSVGEIVSRAETCARRGRLHLAESATRRSRDGRSPPTDEHERERSLQRQLAVLETLLAKFRSGDALTNGDGSLTAELEAARDVCHMVEALIEVEAME